MPRKAKEEVNEVKKSSSKKLSTSKKVVEKRSTTKSATNKKTPSKEKNTSVKKRATTNKTVKAEKKVQPKKATIKKTAEKKETKRKKTVSKTKIESAEYYDLPYHYNKTVVKVLAQTPNTLFVYWDISDEDRKNYIEQYGPYFFNDTKPVLIIHNKTKNYDFEVDINDFANSWYLHLVDSNCKYEIELGRRPINEYAKIENYLPISNSNSMESPNDHILLDKLSHVVYFKNVKTNEVKTKTTLSLLKKIGKISSIAEFYQKLYPEEEINFTKLDLRNPSSSSFFK